MRKIGLTGGIGTGKTFISKMFVKKGIPVFYADDEAKRLYADEQVLQQIRDNFGDTVFDGNHLDIKKMAALVFTDEDALQQLESIIHPKVMAMFEEWASQQHSDEVIMESAILFEAHLEKYFDHIIVVNASVGKRIERIQRRNPELTEAEVMVRINRQMPQEKKCALADEVIEHEEDW